MSYFLKIVSYIVSDLNGEYHGILIMENILIPYETGELPTKT